jgi:acetyltransferase-like isoleucine patch superfamily enzyme
VSAERSGASAAAEAAPPTPTARTARQAIRRASEYATVTTRAMRPRYALAHLVARLLPRFTFGPVIARVYRWGGVSVGAHTSFMGPLRLLGGDHVPRGLTLGSGVIIGSEVVINLDGPVTIGDGASIGPFVRIYSATHPIGPGSRRMTPQAIGKPVTIGRGAWVGLGSIVLPGVTVGDGCVVGAGSVVTADTEPHTYVEGNPARTVRTLPWADR